MKFLNNPFRSLLLALFAGPILLLSGCDDGKDPKPDNNDNELITTVRYMLTPVGGGPRVIATFRDLDGPGGTAPTITPLTLAANTSYFGSINFLDETKNPLVDLTEEIEEEGNDHLIGYTTTPAGLLTIVRTDLDANMRELGLTTTLRANAAGTGSLRVVLYHQPGTKDGTANPGGGEAEVSFPVTVQ